MEIPMLKVEARTETGKGPARRLRARGLIPAVCYGHQKEPLPLAVNPHELTTILRGPRGLNSLIKLDGAEGRTVFVQDFQRDPLARDILHVDFLHVDVNKPVEREVLIDFTGKAEGVKLGGILQVARRSALVEALPTDIPDKLMIDVSPLMMGDSLHIADVALPPGVKALYDQNFAICSVVAPAEEKAAVEEPVEAAEGEEAAAEGEEEGAEAKAPAKKEGEDNSEKK